MSSPHVVIAYKNFPVAHHVSHIGLGVSALNTAKVLRNNHISTDVWAILGCKTIEDRIRTASPRPTHVIISAPWLPTLDLQNLIFRHHDIQFAVVCHSNVGFLQADPQAIKNFREDLDLEQGALNFTAAGNSKRFCHWIREAYVRPCTELPNLYFMEHEFPRQHRPWQGGVLRVGAFGAVRPLKNHLTAAAAALELAANLNTEVEFHINVGRVEGGYTVVRAIHAMLDGTPNVTLVEDPWLHWPLFRKLVRSMHVMIQPSYTESFNMVTADGAAECVPSVVSDAIEWAPIEWQANVDEAMDVARKARTLVFDPRAGTDGFAALRKHNERGVRHWREWIARTMPLTNTGGIAA